MSLDIAADAPAQQAQATRQWIAPLLSSVVTIPAALFAWFYAGLAPMACDSCTDAQAAAFDPSYERAYTVFGWGLTISLLILATAWLLPWEERFEARRTGFAALAPMALLATVLTFAGMVDWP
ncbi:hypothetical protein [Streptomyces sp. NPDC016845]|uniref:hypothetical protein n=1 Tax=Streptomyces sp. NPDC016845 TaxID=3364972 RepID=UPI0037A96A41